MVYTGAHVIPASGVIEEKHKMSCYPKIAVIQQLCCCDKELRSISPVLEKQLLISVGLVIAAALL